MRHKLLFATACCAAFLGCKNAGESLVLPPLQSGAIGVGVYLDRNATHALDAGDTVFAGVRVALLLPGGTDTLRTATTNSQGIAVFDSVPIGSYRVVVDRHALGDSIGVIAGDTGITRITANPDSLGTTRIVRLGFTEVSLAQARALPPGQRVVVHAHVLSPLQAFRDSTAFLNDTSGNIRVTQAVPQTGHPGNLVGDSVLVLATTARAQGQGILTNAVFTTIANGLSPLPQLVSVADARTAQNGALDAALVQLSNVIIVDTVPATPDFIVKVADPANPAVTINVVFDQLLNAPHGLFPPGHTGTFRGVLIPNGDGTWFLKPRGSPDVVVN